MSLTAADYTTITSKDGESFVVETRLLPTKFNKNMGYSAKIVEKIIEYLHYKYMHQTVNQKKLPVFEIEPSQAL